ncbi:MAG: hypothetical protein WKF34_11700 [Pyrinomonadaceae bacterium]
MNPQKTQNSLLVLAALGVYFGLVIAGATPQVLAQAAMAKQFDAKDEISKSDDLEKKTDDKRSPVTASVQIYLEDVEYFLASLSRLTAQAKFDPKKDTFNLVQATLLPCVANNLAGRYTPVRFEASSEASRSSITNFSSGMVYGYSLGDCVANTEFDGVEAVDSRFTFKLDDKGLSAWLEVKKSSDQNAEDLKRDIDQTLKLYSTPNASRLRRQIIKYTSTSFRQSHSILRLHLARSDLVSLLASDAN